MTPTAARRTPRALMTSAVLVLGLTLSACSGGEEEQSGPDAAAALASAKRSLDATSGIDLELSTPELPSSVTGLLGATGVGTPDPSFEGEIRVSVAGVGATVPVISVDGTTYATLPFTTDYVEVDASQFGAPDPADLFGPQNGLSSLLTKVRNPVEGDQVRDGDAVLTRYTGTLPGAAVQSVVPVAPADASFDATVTLDDSQRLTKAVIAGPFYGADAGDVTYTVAINAYDLTPQITAP